MRPYPLPAPTPFPCAPPPPGPPIPPSALSAKRPSTSRHRASARFLSASLMIRLHGFGGRRGPREQSVAPQRFSESAFDGDAEGDVSTREDGGLGEVEF